VGADNLFSDVASRVLTDDDGKTEGLCWEPTAWLQESRGDNGEGASTTRNAHRPGDPNSSQKTDSDTAADKRAEQVK